MSEINTIDISKLVNGQVQYMDTEHEFNNYGEITNDISLITCKDIVDFDSSLKRLRKYIIENDHKENKLVLVKSNKDNYTIIVKEKKIIFKK